MGAVISTGSKILFLQRQENDFMGGIIELPSGLVKNNETLKEALHREVKEETNLKIKSIKRFLNFFDYESKKGKKQDSSIFK